MVYSFLLLRIKYFVNWYRFFHFYYFYLDSINFVGNTPCSGEFFVDRFRYSECYPANICWSPRGLEDVTISCLPWRTIHRFLRYLNDVFKTSWRRFKEVWTKSWRPLEDLLAGENLLWLRQTSFELELKKIVTILLKMYSNLKSWINIIITFLWFCIFIFKIYLPSVAIYKGNSWSQSKQIT